MLWKTTENRVSVLRSADQKQSVSRLHTNTADWHYTFASEVWEQAQALLTEGEFYDAEKKHPIPDGLFRSVSDKRKYAFLEGVYAHHTMIADKLMRLQ